MTVHEEEHHRGVSIIHKPLFANRCHIRFSIISSLCAGVCVVNFISVFHLQLVCGHSEASGKLMGSMNSSQCLSLVTGRIIILTVRIKGAIREVFAALYIIISKILHPLESGLLININDSQSAERFGF